MKISRDASFSFNDFIVGARLGPTSPVDMLMNKTFWTGDLTYTSAGRYYTFNIDKNITHANEDYLAFVLNTTTVAAIHVHDKKYFLMNTNPLGPPTNTRSIFPGSTPSQYQVPGMNSVFVRFHCIHCYTRPYLICSFSLSYWLLSLYKYHIYLNI